MASKAFGESVSRYLPAARTKLSAMNGYFDMLV